MKPRFSSRQTIGAAFPDFISTDKGYGSHKHVEEGFLGGKRAMRGFLLPFLLFFLVGMLVARLLSIVIFQGKYYSRLAENNRVKTTTIYASRGIIYDRNGVPLVFNMPGFRQRVGDKTIILTHEEATSKIANGEKNIEIDSLRQYPYKDAFAHVLGYIGQITKEELNKPQFSVYKPGDIVGKTGIEQIYEQELRGVDGKQLIEVDALGKLVRTLGQKESVSGHDVALTIDKKLQEAAFNALKDIKKGAVIAATPKGEILAMVSKPSFDPNLFTMGKTYQASDSAYSDITAILTDNDNQPLLNRAVAGIYPPGSTFKLITAIAALEEKKIDEKFSIMDTGVLQVGTFSFGSWYFLQYGRTEGELNVVGALKRSNDIFFYKTAEKLGVDDLAKRAKMFGLGQKLGIDLEGEAAGLVPDPAWKQKALGEQWYLGDTYHYGIGQGYLLATPLQINTFTQAIVNEGKIYKPHLFKNNESRIINNANLSKKNVDLIREGMIQSCSPGGVAWPLFEFKISVACKTGTAQHGTEKDLPHAWITLWAPANEPQVIITVLAESSGEGSNIAAPIAKKILDEWFSR
ncbi:MAG: penicillin-binding protein 2 [Candidatus Levyibacteriota bacterium]|nr:MAG: penicillin-binding protein 2 [Candidatus Levybacteria bacterium]